MSADERIAAAAADWARARAAAQAVLREPGMLAERELMLLRVALLPQLEGALAALDAGRDPEQLAHAHAFLPGAVAALGDDAGLAALAELARRGLAALAG